MLIYKKILKEDMAQFLELANKMIYERGLNETDFDRTMFNFNIKNWLVDPSILCFGSWLGETLIGFSLLLIDHPLHNKNKRMNLELLYVLPEHRTIEYYKELVGFVYSKSKELKIDILRTPITNFTLDQNEMSMMMMRVGFKIADTIYDLEIN